MFYLFLNVQCSLLYQKVSTKEIPFSKCTFMVKTFELTKKMNDNHYCRRDIDTKIIKISHNAQKYCNLNIHRVSF